MQYIQEQPLSLPLAPDATLYDLQSNLLEVWTKLKVDDYYQNIVLRYLDTLPLAEAEQQIAQQIKNINEGSSVYFKLAYSQSQRKKALEFLSNLVDRKNQNTTVDQEKLSKICQQLSCLRDYNLDFAQTLIHLYQSTSQLQCVVSDQCMIMLKNLDEGNQFLKSSFLKDFIMFQKGYDPFFIYHYDIKNKKEPHIASPVVDQLFTLSLSYACRLFKVKNQLIDILTHKKIRKIKNQEYYKSPVKNVRKIRLASSDTPDGSGSDGNQPRGGSMYFSRKKYFPKKIDQRSRQDSYHTINCQSIQNSRKASSMMKSIPRTDDEPLRPHGFLPSLKISRMKNSISYPTEPLNYRFKTEADEDHNSIYRITRKRPLRKGEDETISSSQIIEDEEEGSPQRRCNYKYQKQLHPLIKYKRSLKNSNSDQSNKDVEVRDGAAQRPKLKFINNMPGKEVNQNQGINSQVRIHTTIQHGESQQETGRQPQTSNFQPSTTHPESKQGPASQNPSSKLTPIKLKQIKKTNKQNPSESQISVRTSTISVESSSLKHPIKMKSGKYNHQELIQLIRTANFIPSIKEIVKAARWEESLRKFQSYITQFVSGDQTLIITVTLLVPDGNYLLKLWGVLEQCPQNVSLSLFKRYIDYLEKTTDLNCLFYNGPLTEQIKAFGFNQAKPKSFTRARKLPKGNKEHHNPQFLSLKCSNIIIDQKTVSSSIFISEQIQKFSSRTCYQLPSLMSIDKGSLNENLQMHVKIGDCINDMETLNQLLQDQTLDTYQTNKDLNIQNVKALRLNLNSMFKAPFIATDNVLTFQGSLVSKTDKTTICLIPCTQYNINVFFGLGFPNISKFINSIKIDKVEPCQFGVHMFEKQLYGRLDTNTPVDGCYGNWQITMSYEDQLPGVVRHDFSKSINFGDESFFVAIQIEGEMAYGFEVLRDDFL